jgi:hypothetical protein
MCNSKVIRQADALLGEPCEIGVSSSQIVVGVFEPDYCHAIESFSFDPLRGTDARERSHGKSKPADHGKYACLNAVLATLLGFRNEHVLTEKTKDTVTTVQVQVQKRGNTHLCTLPSLVLLPSSDMLHVAYATLRSEP